MMSKSHRLTTEASEPDVASVRVDRPVHPGNSAPIANAQATPLAHDNARRQRLGRHDRRVRRAGGWIVGSEGGGARRA